MNKQQLELKNEQWLPIEGYEELYQVSNFGRVKSLERINSLGRTVKERILKPSTKKDDYQQVKLWKDGKPKTFLVHRLVGSAFIPNPNNYTEINHKDENPSNNHVDNLEWCNRKYNCNYGRFIEKHSKAFSGANNPMYGKFGKEHNRSKQVIQLTLDGEVVKTWNSAMDVQRKLGYYQSSISACCRGKQKSTNGYKWQFA